MYILYYIYELRIRSSTSNYFQNVFPIIKGVVESYSNSLQGSGYYMYILYYIYELRICSSTSNYFQNVFPIIKVVVEPYSNSFLSNCLIP